MKTLFTSKKILIGLVLTLSGQLLTAQTAFCFKTKVDYPLGPDPTDIVARDLNNDGIIDLAVSNYGSSINLRRLMGMAGGTFSTAVGYSFITTGSHAITAGTFGGGTTVQLALTNFYGNNVSVLANTGAGAFTFGASFTVGSMPAAIINNDFNADGNLDLVVANSGGNTISVLKGLAGGNFVASVNYIVGTYPTSIASGDFNGDGNLDLVVTNYTPSNVSILRGSPTGTFAAAVNYAVGTNPYSVTTGDFNSDGFLDLAVANYNSNNISILRGSSTGTFAAAVNYSAGPSPRSIVSADFNSDGFLDLACANYGSNYISIFAGSVTGVFSTAVSFTTDNTPIKIVTADFNADGKADIATVNGNQSVSVLLNGAPTFSVNNGSVCIGSSYTIQPTGGSLYTYSSGSAVVTPTANTSYTVTGCSITNTIVCTVSVSPLPIISVNSGSVCSGQIFTITPSGANTYTYSLIVGASTFTNTGSTLNGGPPFVGTYLYNIVGTDVNGCISNPPITSTVIVSACATSAIQSSIFENNISVYPNPNNGTFIIKSTKDELVTITNELGQIIKSINLNKQNDFSIEVLNLQSGIYFLIGVNVKHKIIITQ